MEDHSHDWTLLLQLIALSHISVRAFGLCGLRSRSPCSFQASKSCGLWPHRQSERQLWGFEEVGEHCCNPYCGHEDTAGHRAPAQSSSFCNQLPECCASLEIRGSLPRKVTQQSNTRSLSWDNSCCTGPEGSGIQGETVANREKSEVNSVEPPLTYSGKMGINLFSSEYRVKGLL